MTAKNQYEVSANFDGERKLVGLATRTDVEGQHVVHLFDEFENANLIDVEVSDDPVDDPKKVVPAAPKAAKS